MSVFSSGSYFHLSPAKGHFFIRFRNYKKHQKKRKYLWNSLKMQAHNKGPQAFFFRFQIANSVVFWPNFLGDFKANFEKNMASLSQTLLFSIAPAKRVPLDFRRKKVFLYFFGHKKRKPFDTCLKNSLVVLQFSFLCHHKLKLNFFG